MDPINSKSTWALQPCGNHLFHIATIQIGSHDAIKRDIRPEHQLLAVVEVKGNGIFQVVQEQRILGAMRQHLSDINSIGEEQHWLWP